MKVIIFVVAALFLVLAVSGCTNLAAYGENPFGDIGIDVESPDLVSYRVDYISSGVIITGVLNKEGVFSAVGVFNYDSNKFDIGYRQISDWLCKYNPETSKIACASTSPAATGDVFEFKLVAKRDTVQGKYPVSLYITEMNGEQTAQDLDIVINVKN